MITGRTPFFLPRVPLLDLDLVFFSLSLSLNNTAKVCVVALKGFPCCLGLKRVSSRCLLGFANSIRLFLQHFCLRWQRRDAHKHTKTIGLSKSKQFFDVFFFFVVAAKPVASSSFRFFLRLFVYRTRSAPPKMCVCMFTFTQQRGATQPAFQMGIGAAVRTLPLI